VTVRVLLAEDQAMVRGALSALLAMEGDIEIVAEASRGDEVLPAALDAFPRDLWGRLLTRQWRRSYAELFGYREPAGYRPLREAIAAYVGAARGVRCVPDQVLVVAGSQQALDLAARLLLDPGDAAWVEDPGYPNARGALAAAGARLVPVPVDREGLVVERGIERRADARLAYVTPANQFPLGVSLSLPRRLALLEWAHRSGAWIIEDDYDSEYRYAGPPLPALQGIDGHGRVIYVGTFSKVLYPGLRLGYLILPVEMVDAFAAARLFADAQSPVLEQAVTAEFINEGHFSRHVRRMRTLYAERQTELVRVAREQLDGLLHVTPAEGGMHLVARLPDDSDDRQIAHRAADLGIWAAPLSTFGIAASGPRGLLLGFAAVDAVQIRMGARILRRALTLPSGGARAGAGTPLP
jgi:GntR family transcriptional regulator/MocR family aminotransferase